MRLYGLNLSMYVLAISGYIVKLRNVLLETQECSSILELELAPLWEDQIAYALQGKGPTPILCS